MKLTFGNILVKEHSIELKKDGLVISSVDPIFAIYEVLEISEDTAKELGFPLIDSRPDPEARVVFSAISRIPITDNVMVVNIKDCLVVLDNIKELEEII